MTFLLSRGIGWVGMGIFLTCLVQGGERIEWHFPTENRALLDKHPEKFYQPTISRRLISGTFGFVRTSEPEPARIFEHFHKGIDIRPVHLDASGEPTDVVEAAVDGEVVRVNRDEKISDYGRQVIVRHLWGIHPVYTIYGHLASVGVEVGQIVKAGDPLGVMGWTGPGLTRNRAHLHFEVAFQINRKFADWVESQKPGRLWQPNRHGEWNGLNLMGIDPVPLLLASAAGNPLSWPEARTKLPGGFIVRVPELREKPSWTDLVEVQEGKGGSLGWEIEMTPWGLPLRMKGVGEAVVEPVLVANPGVPSEGKYYCRGLVQANGKGGMKLSRFGRQTIEMMLFSGK
jgi:Peptidase family M23